MTSFSKDICEYAQMNPEAYKAGGIFYLLKLIKYIRIIRDDIFPNILLACPDNKAVQAIVRDALKQLEDM